LERQGKNLQGELGKLASPLALPKPLLERRELRRRLRAARELRAAAPPRDPRAYARAAARLQLHERLKLCDPPLLPPAARGAPPALHALRSGRAAHGVARSLVATATLTLPTRRWRQLQL
jgi:hypothetical protein